MILRIILSVAALALAFILLTGCESTGERAEAKTESRTNQEIDQQMDKALDNVFD